METTDSSTQPTDPNRDPREIVRSGYDRISHAYRADAFDYARSHYQTALAWLEPLLPLDVAVLDLGCGCGVPVSQVLAARYAVTGVDLSPVQIERARRLVPQAEFLCADMTVVDFAPAGFAAVVAFYSIIHVPLDEQPALLARISRWLQPGGYLLATVGHYAWTGTEANWLGVDGGHMYWSHADAATYRCWFAEQELVVLREEFIPEGDGGHALLLAQKAVA